jgi:hypothetical protein
VQCLFAAQLIVAPRLTPGGSKVKGTGRSQFSRAFVVGMALILESFAAPMPIAAAQGTSIASATVPGSLPDMLGHLPNLPLVQSNATITYTNLAAQAAATGVLHIGHLARR